MPRPADREEYALFAPCGVFVVPLQAVVGRPVDARLAARARGADGLSLFKGTERRRERGGRLPAALKGEELVIAVVALAERVGQSVKVRDNPRVPVRCVLQPHRPLNHGRGLVERRVHRHRQRLSRLGVGQGVVRAHVVVRSRLQALFIRREDFGEIHAVHREVKGQASALRALQNLLGQVLLRALEFVLGGPDLIRVERIRTIQVKVFVAGETGLQLQRAAARTAGRQRKAQAEQQYERNRFFHCFSHVNLLSSRGPRILRP